MTQQLDITQATLLDNLIEITLPSGETIDLHNDFSCERIEYEETSLRLHFLQDVHGSTNDRRQIVVEFRNATFNKLLELYPDTSLQVIASYVIVVG